MLVKRKFYVYIDESGQDTGGALFVVGVVILEKERELLLAELEAIEEISGKKNFKWRKTRHSCRQQYIELLLQASDLKDKIFFETFKNTKQYLEMTTYAAAKALIRRAQDQDYRASIYVDGFGHKEISKLSKGLRDLNIKRRKVIGVRREESNVFIRLADAVCGLVRDVYGGNPWAADMLKRLKKKGIISAL